jgi:aspartyl-tRNA(Asn)/glutamyl-tRNA(Gln) amidotransferase subunit B
MPVMNKLAVEYTVKAGLMLNCTIPLYCTFDRKSYFYPDMPKNYQITQYDKPFCLGGTVPIVVDGVEKSIRMRRIHLEEDVAKNTHFSNGSGVDFNRAGIPLMEIVSEPDIRTADEALAYLHSLKQTMLYAGVGECNLEKGNMRCDVNCSTRLKGEQELGTKTEIKNMNTFKGVHAALSYEMMRQREVLSSGGVIVQETRRWDPDREETQSMRSKEDAHDYRYFPEPDLMPVVFTQAQIDDWAKHLPERPRERRERFLSEYQLPEYDVDVLLSEKELADYFEAIVEQGVSAKPASNWVMTEVLRLLSEKDLPLSELGISASRLAGLIKLTESNAINSNSAKEVFSIMVSEGGEAEDIVKARGMAQVSDSGEIGKIAESVIAEHSGPADDYRAGKEKALMFLVGQVMRLSKGKANPEMAAKILKEKLDA